VQAPGDLFTRQEQLPPLRVALTAIRSRMPMELLPDDGGQRQQ